LKLHELDDVSVYLTVKNFIAARPYEFDCLIFSFFWGRMAAMRRDIVGGAAEDDGDLKANLFANIHTPDVPSIEEIAIKCAQTAIHTKVIVDEYYFSIVSYFFQFILEKEKNLVYSGLDRYLTYFADIYENDATKFKTEIIWLERAIDLASLTSSQKLGSAMTVLFEFAANKD
jgi:hypothetical protein